MTVLLLDSAGEPRPARSLALAVIALAHAAAEARRAGWERTRHSARLVELTRGDETRTLTIATGGRR